MLLNGIIIIKVHVKHRKYIYRNGSEINIPSFNVHKFKTVNLA